MNKEKNLAALVGARSQLNVSDQLFQKISELILSGQLEEGYVFPNETVLCEQLQVGRTTLREAYKALELLGYVKRTKRGTSVNSRTTILNATPLKTVFSSVEPKDFSEFRIMLESQSAYLAAQNARLAETKALEENIARSYQARREKNFEELMVLDAEFHHGIAALSKNALIMTIVTVMTSAWDEGIRRNFFAARENHPEIFDMMLKQHSAIALEIRNGDCEAAKEAMREHICKVTDKRFF